MKERTFEETSALLLASLRSIGVEETETFLNKHEAELMIGPHPFADYMRMKFREKGILQQEVFLAADLSENYGYMLISEEKHTRQRDVILRLCLAARFPAEEIQTALILYGMAPLYVRFPRDTVLMIAVQNGVYGLEEINRLLVRHSLAPILHDYE